MSGNIFYTGVSGLNVARSGLLTTAHNTANVYTAGYSRQVAHAGSNVAIPTNRGFIGTGASITTVTRSYDRFVSAQLTEAESVTQALDAYAAQAARVDSLLADSTSSLATMMQGFFAGVQDVANNPADPGARQQLIGSANVLVSKFRTTDEFLGQLNASINGQIDNSAGQITTYAREIAKINQQISQTAALSNGQPPNDLLDQRDQLVSSLSKIVGVRVLEQENGQYDVSFSTGQALVRGTSAAVVRAVESAVDPSRQALAVVPANGKPIELDDQALAGGTLGGLLSFRDEMLMSTRNAVGRMAMAVAQTFNAQHRLGVDLNGAPGKDLFAQGSPAVLADARNGGNLNLAASVYDTVQLTTSDYSIEVGDAGGQASYTVTRLSDKQVIGTYTSLPTSFDGVTLSALSGTAKVGDSFMLQPTRNGARDIGVLLGMPADIAAAAPVVGGIGLNNRGTTAVSGVKVDASYLQAPLSASVTLSYGATMQMLSGFPAGVSVTVTPAGGQPTSYPPGSQVPYVDGASIAFGGLSFTLKGAPLDGDQFTLKPNMTGQSDGSNALLLGALQRQKTMAGGTTTFSGAYSAIVNEVGNRTLQVQSSQTAQTTMTEQIRTAQQSISGVNQDEETTNLLMFQQMYQANAKVIQAASTIFDAILGLQ